MKQELHIFSHQEIHRFMNNDKELLNMKEIKEKLRVRPEHFQVLGTG